MSNALGTLCKRNHDWNGSGKSMRFPSGACIECMKIVRKPNVNDSVYQRNYYKANRDRVLNRMANAYAADPGKFKRRRNAYEATERGRNTRRLIWKRWDARKRTQKSITYSVAELEERFCIFNNSCAYCGSVARLTIDHFFPLSSGGEDAISNIVPACASCNCSKRSSNPVAWYTSRSFFNDDRWKLKPDTTPDWLYMAYKAGAEWQRERDAGVVDEYYSGYDGVMRVREGKPDEYVGLMENVAERIRKGDA